MLFCFGKECFVMMFDIVVYSFVCDIVFVVFLGVCNCCKLFFEFVIEFDVEYLSFCLIC